MLWIIIYLAIGGAYGLYAVSNDNRKKLNKFAPDEATVSDSLLFGLCTFLWPVDLVISIVFVVKTFAVWKFAAWKKSK